MTWKNILKDVKKSPERKHYKKKVDKVEKKTKKEFVTGNEIKEVKE